MENTSKGLEETVMDGKSKLVLDVTLSIVVRCLKVKMSAVIKRVTRCIRKGIIESFLSVDHEICPSTLLDLFSDLSPVW